MTNSFELFDLYIENLLLAQYEVSEIFPHNLTKGEVREDFIKDQCKIQFDNIVFAKGQIANLNNRYSSQLDIIVCNKNTRMRKLGSHDLVASDDCKVIIEVKSKLNNKEANDFNKKSRRIKRICTADEKPLCGLVTYTLGIKTDTFLINFGYKYNKLLKSFIYDKNLKLQYPNIDFILSLHKDDEKNAQFYLRKDNQKSKYILSLDMPVSKDFFKLLEYYNKIA